VLIHRETGKPPVSRLFGPRLWSLQSVFTQLGGGPPFVPEKQRFARPDSAGGYHAGCALGGMGDARVSWSEG